MSRDIIILSDGLPGQPGQPDMALPLSPEDLAAVHPLWAGDAAALGPFAEAAPLGSFGTVRRALGCCGPGVASSSVAICGSCGSSMDVARRLVVEGALGVWGSVLAPEQYSGRGQLRRAWLSRPGNLHATLVCPPETGLWNDLRPLVLGYLFAEALSDLGQSVQVKWPNDLLSSGRKVAGMLVEERADCVLAGIGLNLCWAPSSEELRDGHSIGAGKFCPSDGMVGPARIWLALVNRMETSYKNLLEAFSPSEFLTIFRSRMAWQGRRVLVQEGASVRYEAVVKGISGEGGLVLDRAGLEIVLLAGDVTPV
ncbi:MAG: biotin--[acetyl-CoA-carboxylase] ligase [Humidesulfovibrio sp.]|nr:biotin--[acetyl-CoA-carboxylase] ligase [Humidesulfovibrio sp.]